LTFSSLLRVRHVDREVALLPNVKKGKLRAVLLSQKRREHVPHPQSPPPDGLVLRRASRNERSPGRSLVFSALSISQKFTILLVVSAAFSAINGYGEMMRATRVRERPLFLPLRMPSELELQARWFAGDFGKQFVMPGGDKVNVIQFGTW